MGKGTIVPVPEGAPKAGEIYKHYKGDLYKIVGLALNSDNNAPGEEWVVVYEPLYEQAAAPLFTRPLAQWQETVDLPAGGQGGEGTTVTRFSLTSS
jgi:hypothetical protein